MTHANHVKKSRKVHECGKCGKRIEVGQPYIWWAFKFGSKRIRCTDCPPRQSDLTQSEFWGQVYDLKEQLDGCETFEDAEAIADEIDSLADEQEDKVSNMPDALQDSDTGQLLQDRAEACRAWSEEIRSAEPDEGDTESQPWTEVDYGGE